MRTNSTNWRRKKNHHDDVRDECRHMIYIKSYGAMVFGLDDESGEVKLLLVRQKFTPSYGEFIKGRYSIKNDCNETPFE